jgi:AraC-like DNA-binding protein
MNKIFFNSIIDFFTISLAFFSSILALLLFLKLVLRKDRTRGDNILCLLMLSASIWRFADVFAYFDLFKIIPGYSISLIVISSIAYNYTSPLLYYYGRYYIANDTDTSVKIIPHFIIPTLLSTIIITTTIIIIIFGYDNSIIMTFDKVCLNIVTTLNCVYIIYILIKVVVLLLHETSMRKSLLIGTVIIAILLIGTIMAFVLGNKFVLSILFFLVIAVIYLFGETIYASLQIIRDEAEEGKYIKSQIRDIDIDKILENIDTLMSREMIYHDETISVRSFSEKLGITPHQFSEILNSKLGMGFFPYINSYRINEACDILSRDKKVSVIKIAYHVGFNSLSSFYTAFKKSTGMSPGTYQKISKK